MKDYRNAEIFRLLNTEGIRLGAELHYTDGTKQRINNRDVVRLGEYLRKNNIQLRNAKIGIDGRIIALEGKEVTSTTLSSESKTSEVRTHLRTNPHIDNLRLMSMLHQADDILRRAGFKYGGDERLGLITVQAGLDLARFVNIHGYITEIRENTVKDKNKQAHSSIFVSMEDSFGYGNIFEFICYTDGIVKIHAKWVMDSRKEYSIEEVNEALLDSFSEPMEEYNIYCRSVADIRNALLWLKNNGNSKSAYDIQKCDYYSKYQREAEYLIEESNLYHIKTPYAPVKLRHMLLADNFHKHIIDLVELRRFLNAKFAGTYKFEWKLEKREAILSASKYTSKDILSDSLVDIQIGYIRSLRNLEPSWDTPSEKPRAVSVKYKIHDSVVARGSNRWVKPQEYNNLIWMDEVGIAVDDILASVFRPGVLRSALDVIAYGIIDGKRKYLTSSSRTPLSEEELLCKAQEGTPINGVCFEVLSAGHYKIVQTGIDRFGNNLVKYVESKGKGYFWLQFKLNEIDRVGEIDITTAVPVEIYYKMQAEERTPSLTLKEPVSYTNDTLIYPNSQRGTLDYLGDRLNEIAVARNYNTEQRATLLLRLMRCFKYTPLLDTTHGNKSPVETLLERSGCCLELSVLANTLAVSLGLETALIYRYSPGINDAPYHAILGIKYEGEALRSEPHAREYQEKKWYDGLTYYKLGGYFGMEFSRGTGGHIGLVGYWKGQAYDAVQNTSHEDPTENNQVISIPMLDGYTCGKPLAQSSPMGFTELTKEHWASVKSWFENYS